MKTLYGLIFYKLTWLHTVTKPSEDGGDEVIRDCGYYLIKRRYMWVLFSPVIIIIKWLYKSFTLLCDIFKSHFGELFTYRVRYIQPKQDKMTFRTKLNFIKRLL